MDAYAQRLWGILEFEAAGQWFLGDRFSAIDIFIATMTQWRPRRPWFAAHTPKLAAIATSTDTLPELASVWVRNFPPPVGPLVRRSLFQKYFAALFAAVIVLLASGASEAWFGYRDQRANLSLRLRAEAHGGRPHRGVSGPGS